MDDNAKVRETLKEVEKELYRVNKALEEVKQLSNGIASVYSGILSIERIGEENPSINPVSKKLIKEKNVLGLYKKMDSLLSELRKSLKGFEEDAVRANLFLEEFRTNRNYFFPDSKAMKNFIEAMYPLFAINSVSFKPEFIGTVELNSIENELKLQVSGQHSLIVPTEKLTDLLNYLEKKRILKNSRLENELLKVVFRNENAIAVEGDNTRIKRIDRLAKEMNLKYSED